MRDSWSEDPLAHGYFVMAGTVYLAWSRRRRVEQFNPRPAFAALPLLALVSCLSLAGTWIGSDHLRQVCLVAMFVGVTWAVLGTAAARTLMFPLGLLVFALPVGERIAPLLQEFTARSALKLLALSGVQPLLDGHVIVIDGDRWRVSAACGGINYLMASLAVGYVYAGSIYRERGHRVAFLVASALVPLAANVLRVYSTILLDYNGATRIVAGMGHYLYGVFVFGAMMTVLFVTCGTWREAPSAGDGPSPIAEGTAAASTLASPPRTVLCAALAMVLIAIGPVATRLLFP